MNVQYVDYEAIVDPYSKQTEHEWHQKIRSANRSHLSQWTRRLTAASIFLTFAALVTFAAYRNWGVLGSLLTLTLGVIVASATSEFFNFKGSGCVGRPGAVRVPRSKCFEDLRATAQVLTTIPPEERKAYQSYWEEALENNQNLAFNGENSALEGRLKSIRRLAHGVALHHARQRAEAAREALAATSTAPQAKAVRKFSPRRLPVVRRAFQER